MPGFLKKSWQNDKKEKVVVLGIDDVPCSLLRRFIAENSGYKTNNNALTLKRW